MTKIVDMYVYLRTNFQVFRIILPTFRQGGGEFTPPLLPPQNQPIKNPPRSGLKDFK